MSATVQVVANAINRSKSHNEIVTIEVGPSGLVCAGGGVTGESVCEALFAECEGDAKGTKVHEFWGEDLDENTWRVHVRRVDL